MRPGDVLIASAFVDAEYRARPVLPRRERIDLSEIAGRSDLEGSLFIDIANES